MTILQQRGRAGRRLACAASCASSAVAKVDGWLPVLGRPPVWPAAGGLPKTKVGLASPSRLPLLGLVDVAHKQRQAGGVVHNVKHEGPVEAQVDGRAAGGRGGGMEGECAA